MAPAGLVTDSSLAFLARRLRLLGYDVLVLPGARLDEVLEAARREERLVLTLSPRHPRRFADVRVMHLPREKPEQSLRSVAATEPPSGAPFSRCSECNTPLQRRHPLEAHGEVPGPILRTAPLLAFCPGCGKWYWEGSHVARLKAWLEAALGRSLDAGSTGP